MTPSRRRLFVLLGAYEDLTDRESSALRRGDIDYVLSIQARKTRLTEAMQQARRDVDLPPEDTSALNERIRALQARETGNLDVLRAQMAQVQESLSQIGQAAQRSRNVRRGYTVFGAGSGSSGVGVLGRA